VVGVHVGKMVCFIWGGGSKVYCMCARTLAMDLGVCMCDVAVGKIVQSSQMCSYYLC